MSKFKVGDMVAPNNSPNVLLGQVMCEAFGGYYIKTEKIIILLCQKMTL